MGRHGNPWSHWQSRTRTPLHLLAAPGLQAPRHSSQRTLLHSLTWPSGATTTTSPCTRWRSASDSGVSAGTHVHSAPPRPAAPAPGSPLCPCAVVAPGPATPAQQRPPPEWTGPGGPGPRARVPVAEWTRGDRRGWKPLESSRGASPGAGSLVLHPRQLGEHCPQMCCQSLQCSGTRGALQRLPVPLKAHPAETGAGTCSARRTRGQDQTRSQPRPTGMFFHFPLESGLFRERAGGSWSVLPGCVERHGGVQVPSSWGRWCCWAVGSTGTLLSVGDTLPTTGAPGEPSLSPV